ncbi:claudin-8 [Nothobranchius furzeri]|uniref:Claudin 8.3 n=1 Tax=Nothobranchius furzeri TaxID=105023 RepID=A0A8C6NUS4_NOTFU|nr:claudin-8 [Nothobranchius furzeri]KAF7218794.1 claudin-8-like [Nothobranchius furzeri]
MVTGVSEIAAVCLGLIGLVGVAATTGLPMWKVTAFIGENIIVMETRWEGLWMNCYRQANIRLQCKVYDSLLYLPPELQAARGLMCCSVALSGVGILVALAGMKCVACLQENKRAKTIILVVAGAMQLLACICVLIPVSWTGHVIIQDFYNPLLIDAQRRELGEALYIGWVTGGLLFASAMLFLCRHIPSDEDSFDVYHPHKLRNYCPATADRPALTSYDPISGVPSRQSMVHQSSLQNNGFGGQQLTMPLLNVPHVMTNHGAPITPSIIYNPGPPEHASLIYQGSTGHYSSVRSSNHAGSVHAPGNSMYMTQNVSPYSTTHTGGPTMSYQPSLLPVAASPAFMKHQESRMPSVSYSESSRAVYI